MAEKTRGSEVFISYARRDGLELSRHLDHDLTANGVTTWRDERQLNPEMDFTAELETAIENAARVVCCVTPDVRRADSFVRREIGYALAVGKPIVPLIFEDTIPPISIVNVTREDFTHIPWKQALRRLLDRLARGETHQRHEADAYIDYLSTLYKEIVTTLRQLVFTEIELWVDLEMWGANRTQSSPATLSSVFSRGRLSGAPGDSATSLLTVRQAFARAGDRLLLVGQAGCGKTVSMLTFTRDAVARRMDDPTQPLPILAPIAAWPEMGAPLASWLASQLPALSEADIAGAIRNDQALLVLDGLDELPIQFPRERFLAELPATGPLLVSSRPSDSLPDEGEHVLRAVARLIPFDDEQLATYVAGSAALAASLRVDPALKELARTPLFLAVLRYCFLQAGVNDELASNLERTAAEIRESIFNLYVRLRLQHEAARQVGGDVLSEEMLYDALGAVAFRAAPDEPMLDNFANHSISKPLEDELGKEVSARFVEDCLAMQIVVRDNMGGIRFAHQLLRRHFGRRACLRIWNQQTLWPDRSYSYNNDAWSSMQAMKKLAWFGDERDVELLVKAALENESHPRACALMALGGIGHPAASGTLCTLLADKHRWHIEAACCDVACWALIQVGESALPALREVTTRTTSSHVLALVLLVLSRIHCEESRLLVESLATDHRAIDKSYGGSTGSELLGYYVHEATVAELAQRVRTQLAARTTPVYDRAPFLRERGTEPWSPY